MFWFAGLLGMGLESRRLRRWLSAVATASLRASNKNSDVVAEPASYGASFNPFPALVIGVTGAAMSAHFQTYLFQVRVPPVRIRKCALTLRIGPNPCTLGLLPHWVCLFALLNVLLCLAQPTAFYSSLAATFGSSCWLLPYMRRSDFHPERRGNHIRCYASGLRWWAILLSSIAKTTDDMLCRRNDVPQCCCCDHVFRILLDGAGGRLQGLAEIQNSLRCILPSVRVGWCCFLYMLLRINLLLSSMGVNLSVLLILFLYHTHHSPILPLLAFTF